MGKGRRLGAVVSMDNSVERALNYQTSCDVLIIDDISQPALIL